MATTANQLQNHHFKNKIRNYVIGKPVLVGVCAIYINAAKSLNQTAQTFSRAFYVTRWLRQALFSHYP
jgi:cAMP phosphodiesterase